MTANKYIFKSELERLIDNYYALGVLEETEANKISVAVEILLPEEEYPVGKIIPFPVPVCSEEERQDKTAWQKVRGEVKLQIAESVEQEEKKRRWKKEREAEKRLVSLGVPEGYARMIAESWANGKELFTKSGALNMTYSEIAESRGIGPKKTQVLKTILENKGIILKETNV
jgi:hypothetical protein